MDVSGGNRVNKLALIGNFLPRQCGLATFTTDTFNAFRDRFPDLEVDVYAMDDHPGRYDYPPEVTRAIAQDELSSYHAAARAIEAIGAQAIWVQHEYGIYGGTAGDHPARPLPEALLRQKFERMAGWLPEPRRAAMWMAWRHPDAQASARAMLAL